MASLLSPAVRQALEADVQGADHGGFILDGLPHIGLTPTHQGHQPPRQLPAEQQIDAGVRTAVQAGQQHQDGEGRSWEHGEY